MPGLCVLVMSKIGKVAEFALPSRTKPGMYWQYSALSSFLHDGMKALGAGRPELTGPFLIILFLWGYEAFK